MIFFDSMEFGSRAQTIAGATYSASNKTRFARVGGTAKQLHEQVHAMLIDKTQSAIGSCATGLGNVKDVIASP